MTRNHNRGPNRADVLFQNIFGERIPDELFTLVAEGVQAATGISQDLFMASPFVQWPLYHLV
jgi:hypothetical protein